MKCSLCAVAALALLMFAEESMGEYEACYEIVSGSSIGLTPLNREGSTKMNIFINKTFQLYGKVSSWRYFASRAGDAYFAVWREEGQLMRMVGSNAVSSPGQGLQSLSVPVEDQIIVEKGDMIGIHYPVTSATTDADEPAMSIMYYEDSRNPSTDGIDESKLSSMITESIYHNYMKLNGLVIRQLSPDKREVAIEAVVDCETCTKTLKGGNPGFSALNYKSSSNMNIFDDKPFVYSGALTTWSFLAYRAGDVYFSVVRKDHQGIFKLIGFNKVSFPRRGLQEFKIPESDQIQVQIGDMIGVHYPDKTNVEIELGALYHRDVRYGRTEGLESGANSPFDNFLKAPERINQDNIIREDSVQANISSTADCR